MGPCEDHTKLRFLFSVRQPFITLGPNDKLPFFHMRNNNPKPPSNEDIITAFKSIEDKQDPKSSSYKVQPTYNLISPSSIPIPNPSISTKPSTIVHDNSYASYANYMCPVSNFSAYSSTPYTIGISNPQIPTPDKNLVPETITIEDDNANHAISMLDKSESREDVAKNSAKMNFEDRFFHKIASPKRLIIDAKPSNVESAETLKDLLDKTAQSKNEKFSLKTSIPISKLDFKTVSSNGDLILPTPYNTNSSKFSIHSMNDSKSILDSKNAENKPVYALETNGGFTKKKFDSKKGEYNAKTDHKKSKNYVTDCQIIKAKPIWGIQEKLNDTPNQNQNHQTFPNVINQYDNNKVFKQSTVKSIIEHFNTDNSKHMKYNVENDAEKKIVFIPSMNHSNMMLALSQPTPITSNSILMSKNVPEGSNSPIKKPKERLLLMDNVKESKVVALKRLHQDNFDENDFENLITENQIYGNKIVIKEKSHAISTKNVKNTTDKSLQSNYLFVNAQLQPKPNCPLILTNKDEHKPQKSDPPTTVPENQSTFSKHSFRTVNPLTQSLSYVKTNVIETKPTNVLQNLLNKPNIKINDGQIAHLTSNPTIISQVGSNKIVYHVPITIERDKYALLTQNKPVNSELALLLSKPIVQNDGFKMSAQKTETKNDTEVVRHSDSEDSVKSEEISSIDVAEKKRMKKRESKRLRVKKSEKKFQKPKRRENNQEFRLNFRQYQLYVAIVGEKYFEESSTEESESESEEDDVQLSDQIRALTADLDIPVDASEDKVNFLNHFGLTTMSDKTGEFRYQTQRWLELMFFKRFFCRKRIGNHRKVCEE